MEPFLESVLGRKALSLFFFFLVFVCCFGGSDVNLLEKLADTVHNMQSTRLSFFVQQYGYLRTS